MHAADGGWVEVGRPGHLGSRRRDRTAAWEAEFGPGRWRLVWRVGAVVHPWEAALCLYEDAYHRRLSDDPDLRHRLIRTARDVYDRDPSDVVSRLDYARQRGSGHHLQDVAVRRTLVRLGRWFAGDRLVRLRRGGDGAAGELGDRLDSSVVPFHRPDLIVRPELDGWWERGSVESFYQSNRVLQRQEAVRDGD
ncbi:hypothetical protein [Micromonospora sp. WMMD714]|uniref:hypothetical protein n=1 Tax=Micromonospora sp. WMMD714 TaxID=3016097 RepID=UPI00249CD4E5|nr:hypothetical protein [Micromonospora sp. WMMD714]WFE65532.1 hypothetical protein O7625_20545 [Micromonospora sp. WMMD714]